MANITNIENIPIVSIIVPVYNAEKYLLRCIESILSQSIQNIELLLVDDGSQDNSAQICDEYSQKDTRVRVIHKENGGVSSARNLGIKEAKGEWITFVDADDYLDKRTIEVCAAHFAENDIVRFSMRIIYSEDEKNTIVYSISEVDKEEYIAQVISRKTLLGVWGGFYKKELFEKYDIIFDKTLISGEDWVVLFQLIQNAARIKIINNPLYQYIKYNETARTNNQNYPLFLSEIRAYGKIKHQIVDDGNEKDYYLELAHAKCELVYWYFVCCLRNNTFWKIAKEYLSEGGIISARDIYISGSTIKKRIVLYFYVIVCKLFI